MNGITRMSDIEIREITSKEFSIWDDMIYKSPQGTVFNLSEWVSTSAMLAHKTPKFIGVFQSEKLCGGCSLYIKNQFHFINSANSVTNMTPFSGVCFIPSNSPKGKIALSYEQLIVNSLRSYLEQEFDLVNIINSPEFRDIRPFTWNNWRSHVFYTYYLDSEEPFEKSRSESLIKSLKKGRLNKINIEKKFEIDVFCDLFIKTYERQNIVSPITKKFLEGMIRMISSQNLGDMWVGRLSTDEIVTATIVVRDNKRVHIWSSGTNPKVRGMGAFSVLLYEVFQALHKEGSHEVNIMTANLPQLTTYFSAFNPILIPYFQVIKRPRWRIPSFKKIHFR